MPSKIINSIDAYFSTSDQTLYHSADGAVTGAGLGAGGGAGHNPKQCHRPAGTPRSSATAAIPTAGG
jgi:hypothetical protein